MKLIPTSSRDIFYFSLKPSKTDINLIKKYVILIMENIGEIYDV